MKTIKTIDLWTEQYINHYECFNGCFFDGFDNNNIPFNYYKIVKNCNCIITVNDKNIKFNNKHNAIIFYKFYSPVRLMVINKETDIEKCIHIALNQIFKKQTLKELYNSNNIKSSIIDLNETPICNKPYFNKEMDIGSCDRWLLLYEMLKGSYTESKSSYGNFQSDKYEFIPNLFIKYELIINDEKFEITHYCAFINELKTRLIPIQEHSQLSKKDDKFRRYLKIDKVL